MDGYEERIKPLQEDPLQNIKLGTDTISGEITIQENKILCVATPYGRGWSVEVDGEEKPLLCVNKHYLGVELPAGEHAVVFRYSTPLKREGFIFSIAAIAMFAGMIICVERKKKRNRM